MFVSFWFVVSILADSVVYRLHEKWFGLLRHEMDVIFYCGMGLSKLLVIVFFFIPWLAIRLVSNKQNVRPRSEASHQAD